MNDQDPASDFSSGFNGPKEDQQTDPKFDTLWDLPEVKLSSMSLDSPEMGGANPCASHEMGQNLQATPDWVEFRLDITMTINRRHLWVKKSSNQYDTGTCDWYGGQYVMWFWTVSLTKTARASTWVIRSSLCDSRKWLGGSLQPGSPKYQGYPVASVA